MILIKYCDYKGTNCNILLYLKTMPSKILIAYYNYYLKQYHKITLHIYPNYFKLMRDMYNNKEITYNDNDDITYGLTKIDTIEIYKLIFKYLNIKLLFIFRDTILRNKDDKNIYIHKNDIKTIAQINEFDIIILRIM